MLTPLACFPAGRAHPRPGEVDPQLPVVEAQLSEGDPAHCQDQVVVSEGLAQQEENLGGGERLNA